MASKRRAALSVFLSLTLAFGTIPTPALAEMADMGEAGATQEAAPGEQQPASADQQAISAEQPAAQATETADPEATVTEVTSDQSASSQTTSRGLGRATVELAASKLPWTGFEANPQATVRAADGSALAADDDYVLVYYGTDGTELEASPVAPGSYLVAARGVADGTWVGETAPAAFEVMQPEFAELAAGTTEFDIAQGHAWAARLAEPGAYDVAVSSDANVRVTAYADAGLARELSPTGEPAAETSLVIDVPEGGAWVVVSQPEGAVCSAKVTLTARVAAPAVDAPAPSGTQQTPAQEPSADPESPAQGQQAPVATPEPATTQEPATAPEPAAQEQPISVAMQDASAADPEPATLSPQNADNDISNTGVFTYSKNRQYLEWSGNRPLYLDDQQWMLEGISIQKYDSNITRTTLKKDRDYTVSYSTTYDGAGNGIGTGTITLTGIGDYTGQITDEFSVIKKVDLSAGYKNYYGVSAYFVCDGYRNLLKRYEYGNPTPSTTIPYPGHTFTPVLIHDPNLTNLVSGIDYTLSFKDSADNPISAISAPGTYKFAINAIESDSSRCTGTFEGILVVNRDLANVLPTLSPDGKYTTFSILDSDASIVENTTYVSPYREYEYATTNPDGVGVLDRIAWYDSSGPNTGIPLVENLDYMVTKQQGEGGTTILSLVGLGAYAGTQGTSMTVRGAGAQEAFDSRVYYPDSAGTDKAYGEIQVDANGVLIEPALFFPKMVQGVDLTFDGYYDSQGRSITTASVGDYVYVRYKGLGTFANASTTLVKQVTRAASSVDFSTEGVGVAFENGLWNGRQWLLLRGQTPSVAVRVYKRAAMFYEGDGFTVTSNTSSDGNQMSITTTANGRSFLTGSRTTNAKLVDKYSLDDIYWSVSLNVRGPHDAEVLPYTSMSGGRAVGSPLALGFAGLPYVPTVTIEGISGVENPCWADPTVSVSLKEADGTPCAQITHVGDYTLVLSGTGDWTGTYEIPLKIYPAEAGIPISVCDLTVEPTATLANGQAKPAVTLSLFGTTYSEGRDYTVEYGSNTEPGQKGWVKVTAKEDNPFRLYGSAARNFVVVGNGSKMDISTCKLELERPDGKGYWYDSRNKTSHIYSDLICAYPLGAKGRVTPKVRVSTFDGQVLPEDAYEVDYGNNDRPGMAYLTVRGKGNYKGSVSGNFYVIEAQGAEMPTTRDGIDWSPVYDPAYYAAQNPDVDDWARRADGPYGDNLLRHFVNNGAKEGRKSKESFELASYYNANADLRRAFGTSDWSRYYRHYVTNGEGENRNCKGVTQLVSPLASRDGVNWSPAYDGNYYAQKNVDVANWARRSFSSGSVLDDAALLQHFVNNGAKEGRRSKDGFELASYYNANADLRRAFGTSDWSKYYRHYVTNGAKENRNSKGVGTLRGALASRDGVDWSPAYDGNYYATQNSDVANWARRSFNSGSVLDDAALLQHFVNNGSKEGRKSKSDFELASYYNANADLRRAFGTSDWSKYYRHYATNGKGERRTCSGVGQLQGFVTSSGGVNWAPTYDANEYASRNPDLARWARRSMGASGSVLDDAALLSHFVNNGQKERRQAKSTFNVTNYRNRYADLNKAFGDNWPSYYRHFATNGYKENRNGA